VRTKLLKFKPNILDEAGPRSGSGDVRILRPSLNSLRSLCSSVLQRLGPSITRITRDHPIFGPDLSVVRFCFFSTLKRVVGYVR
jgi:hypothetical protein